MLRKIIGLTLIASMMTSTVFYHTEAMAATLTMQKIYNYAQAGKTNLLMSYIQYGYSIDIPDDDGNTALCYAIQQENAAAVKRLISLGANRNSECVSQFSDEDLQEVGLVRRNYDQAAVRYKKKGSSGVTPAIWTTNTAIGLAVVGGVVAAVALSGGGGGGGGGGGSTPKEDETTTLDDVKTIRAVGKESSCDGGIWIAGVCTSPITTPAEGEDEHQREKVTEMGRYPEKGSPDNVAEFGGSLTNTESLDYTNDSSTRLVAMQANGVAKNKNVKEGDLINLSTAASVTNASKGSISMEEDSASSGGVVALLGTSAGTINNNGDISITSKSTRFSAGLYAEQSVASGLLGTGRNVTNSGKITITDMGDSTGNIAGIYAEARGVTNKGVVDIILDEVVPTGTETKDPPHGTAYGVYGKNVVNKGTISLNTSGSLGEETPKRSVFTDVHMLEGSGTNDSVIANDGKMDITLDNISFGIRGVWSKSAANLTLKNTGTIDVSGNLYNDPEHIIKEVFLMGADGGDNATIRNVGKINVGTSEKPVDVSNGGILHAMYGTTGTSSTMVNTNDISFHLHADAETALNSFQSYAMTLSEGTLTNDGNLVYSFSNLDEEGHIVPTSEVLHMTPIVVGSASGTNNGKIEGTIKGSASCKLLETGKIECSDLTAMRANGKGNLTNSGMITLYSSADNLSLSGMEKATGDMANTSTGKIVLTVDGGEPDEYGNYQGGYNANLYGMSSTSSSGHGHNAGEIYLKHKGGSGILWGVNGGNSGKVAIEADDMVGTTVIQGYAVAGGDSGENGTVDISLRGRTHGIVTGYSYEPSYEKTGTYVFTDTLNITDKVIDKETGELMPSALDRSGDIVIKGVTAKTDRKKGDDGLYLTNTATAVNNGKVAIDISASKDHKTEIYGMYGNDANVINRNDIKIDVDLLDDSSDYFVVGMATKALSDEVLTKQPPIENKAWNANALTIRVKKSEEPGSPTPTSAPIPTSAPTEYSDFDVIGILTNSYALNTGSITMDVQSPTAKAAGMVAYDGGVVVNMGSITFTGTADFVPMYATGSRHYDTVIKEETKTSKTEEDEEIKTTTKTHSRTDYYGTIYNYGDIVIGSSFVPKGEGYYLDHDSGHDGQYYNPASKEWLDIGEGTAGNDLSARETKQATQVCVGDDCDKPGSTWTPTDAELNADEPDPVTGEWTYYTIHNTETAKQTSIDVFDPIPTPTPVSLMAPKSVAMVSPDNESVNTENKSSEQSGTTENVMEKVNTALNQEVATQNIQGQTTTMQLNDGMRYVSEKGGSIIANGIHLTGNMSGGVTLVVGDNADTYLASGSGSGAVVSDGDYSDLTLDSDSAMFKASYAKNANNSNGLDIVMTRKNFNEILGNSSLASYLENNYQAGNNVAFFDKLKAISSLTGLTDSLDKLTGAGILSRFNFEDMTMMRELNFNMNEQLFHNKEGSFSMAGFVESMAFKGDRGSKSRYSLFNKKNGDMSIGLGIAFSDVKSDDEHKDNGRHESMYQMIVPIGFKMLGFNLMTSPRIGYARGKYDREGFDNMTYNGTIEKRVYGLMNEARYPIDFGSWTLEPAVEFNVLGYTQKGKEDAKDYSLNIKSQNTYSIESGIGLYFMKDKDIGRDRHLKFNAGVAVYHEFADPYKINVGMRGMDGSFQLRDEEHSDNRGVLRLGLDYENKDYTLYSSFMSYIDKEVRTNFKSGVKIKF